ncbi:MAG TPA: AAA family ATPase [Candidatus Limnocylindrales bacterium]|nr:AAA family ATPase [Candidatus Limnocylindrales bacterium]
MRHLYLAATGRNRGKTTVALGLLAALVDRGLATGFIKPVGQRYAIVDGQPADEDAILMRSALGLSDPLSVMSPVHIPRGFTRAYIRGEIEVDLRQRIREAHERVSEGREAVLIEGTGHAGVGAVVELSNATVARVLGAPALIVSEAGVGRPIDEIVLNHALFARHGVEVVGAIVNKVDAHAHPTLPEVLRDGLARHGIELLGMLPYRPMLSRPTLSMLVEQLSGELLTTGPDLDRVIEHVAIGAMLPRHVVEHVGPGSLLIVPGDRTDVLSATLAALRTAREGGEKRALLRLRSRRGFGRQSADPSRTDLAGIVLTGGYRPRLQDLDQLQSAGVFCYLVEEDTYAAASAVHDLLVKIHPADQEKIALIKALAAEHLDVDRILDRFAVAERQARRRGPERPSAPVNRLLAGLRRLGRPAPGNR